MERKTRAATQTGIYLLLVALILAAANVLSFSVSKRFDMTNNERFTLSKGSARLVAEGLKQELHMDVYVIRGLPKFEAFIRDLQDMLREYERAGNGKVRYTIIEAKTDEQRNAAKEAGLREMTVGEGSETGQDQMNISRGYMGIAFKYGSEKDAIETLHPDYAQGLEFWITNKIREIRDRADNIDQKFGVVTGKDEIKLTDQNLVPTRPGAGGASLRPIIEQNFPFYKFEDVDLQGGESEINKELAGIIITQPAKEFTDKELRRIDQFLMLGNKSLVVAAGAVNLKASDPSMKATLNTWGLEKLLDGYGVEMKKEAILDWGRSIAFPVPTQTGQVLYFRAPGILQLQEDTRFEPNEQLLDTSFAGFFRIPELAFPFPSPLVPHPEKQPEAQVKVLARTSPNTTVSTDETLEMKISPEWRPKGEYAQRAIAISVEGKLKSAYGGQEGEGVSAPAQSAEPSRVLVIGAAQFFANPFARAGNPPPMPPQMAMMGGVGGDENLQTIADPYARRYLMNTVLAFKNILDWMSGDSTLLAATAKLSGEPNLTYSDVQRPKEEPTDNEEVRLKKEEEYQKERSKVQKSISASLTLLPAVLFAAFGVFRWRRRESARDRISLD
ncbi:GldG family protein [Chondromyces apiculatus]|uniref:Gliding motility protein GldG n=1 Tax=Chondromyces apiculatus DSM 436 TaxID=1192034 RepID=A0A017T4S9_9BACT|nr:Gldg family protein [Chondromyces apiculatus]EYF03536.1 gliding motility protein GldG [Chondromyces apiculatus DSM 436]